MFDTFPVTGPDAYGSESMASAPTLYDALQMHAVEQPVAAQVVPGIYVQPQLLQKSPMHMVEQTPPAAVRMPVNMPVDLHGLHDRGTMEDPNVGNLFVHQRLHNDPLPTTLHQWGDQPYLAAPYFAQRLDPSAPDYLKNAALAWNAAPDKNAWAAQHPDLAAEVTRSTRETKDLLVAQQDVVRGTATHLDELKQRAEISWVERVFNGTKEFIWNDFGKHPIMSAGAVVAGVMVYRMLKGTPLGKGVAWAGALSIGYHLLRDKFGIKPGEKLAQGVGLFSKEGEERVRTLFDTLRRPFNGPEGDKSAVAFFYEKLGIRDEAEQTMFVALLQENPQTFFAWYNSVTGGAGNNALPTGVRSALNRNARVSSYLEGLTPAEQRKVLLSVSDKMFAFIGRSNPEAAADPRGYILGRYVTGAYYNTLNGAYEVNLAERRVAPGTTPAVRDDIDHLMGSVASCNRAMQMQVRTASQQITFLDVLLAEQSPQDWNELMRYNGLGKDFRETREYVVDTARSGFGFIDRQGNRVIDWATGYDPANPDAKEWKWSLPWILREANVRLWQGLDAIGLQPQDFTNWKESDFRVWYEAGLAAGGATLDKLAETEIGKLIIESSDYLSTALHHGWNINIEGIHQMRNFVEALSRSVSIHGGMNVPGPGTYSQPGPGLSSQPGPGVSVVPGPGLSSQPGPGVSVPGPGLSPPQPSNPSGAPSVQPGTNPPNIPVPSPGGNPPNIPVPSPGGNPPNIPVPSPGNGP